MKPTITAHVHEFRARLSAAVAAFVLGAALGYCFRDQILAWLQAPLHSTIYNSDVILACLIAGLLLAIPLWVYNSVSFVRPFLPRPVTQRQLWRLGVLSCALTLGSVMFAYFVSLPLVLSFLTGIDLSHLHPLIASGSYLGFVIAFLVVFAVIIQLPLLLIFFNQIKPLPISWFRRRRKWVILGAVGAAIILPIVPDPVSQIMLALPVIVIYELSLWLVVLVQRRRTPREATVPEPRRPRPVSKPRPVPQPRPAVHTTKRQPTRDRTVGMRSPIIDMRPSANRPSPPA